MTNEQNDPLIKLSNVNKFFGDFQALKNINLKVYKGERIVICGPSGSGKSTLIRCMNRLESHNDGQIVIEGNELTDDIRDINAVRREVGMVFQSFNLFPHRSVKDNITMAPISVKKIKISEANKSAKKFKNIGGFGSISNIPKNLKNPKIVACTDGVGTKIEIANILNKYDTIGIDLVAMCVNDLIVQGAQPLIFLDYISINKIDLKKLKQILKGIIKGCKISNCELVGGETAEMPGTYSKGKFDIAGFSVGLVDKKKILNKSKIKPNDLILGIPSS